MDWGLWGDFIRGETILTVNVLIGLFFGWLLVRFGVSDRLLARIGPKIARWGIHPDIVTALALSLGSSRVAAGMLASAAEQGRLEDRDLVWGVQLISFPGYLRRWSTSTLGMSIGLAGVAGGIYALSLLLRSAIRFCFFLGLVLRHGRSVDLKEVNWQSSGKVPSLWGMLCRTLPWGWLFFALAFWGMPFLEPLFREWGRGLAMSPVAWSVALAGMAHNSAALAAAGAAVSGGHISSAEAVLALLVGNSLGSLSRIGRQNLAFWSGLFPKKTVLKLLSWYLGTLLPLMFLWILAALLFCRVV